MTSPKEPTVDVKFCLVFPCEAVSIPVARRVLGDTLRNLGVVEECVSDILVAVTEACTNVLRHAGPARRYEVLTNVGHGVCVVDVVDSGPGVGAPRGSVTARARAGWGGAKRVPTGREDRIRGHRGGGRALARAARHRVGDDGLADAGHRGRRKSVPSALRPKFMPPARRSEDQIISRLPESGRGLQIMRAVVDDVTLQSGPGEGTVVSMRKRVAWRQDAPLAGLSGRGLRDAG